MITKILPLTQKKIKILLAIYLKEKLYNNKIAQITNIDKQNVSLHLKKFLKDNIIILHELKGQIKEYSLNKIIIKELKTVFEEYRKEQLFIKYPIIKKIMHNIKHNAIIKKIDNIYLIGSYAQETVQKNSDIDIIICSEKNIQKEIKKLSEEINKTYDVTLEPILYTKKTILKEKKMDSIFYNTTLKNKKNNILLFEK